MNLVPRRHLQFGWTGTPHLANNLAITRLPLPSLLVVNTTTHHYHLPHQEAHLLDHEAVVEFLNSILSNEAEVSVSIVRFFCL